MKKITFWVILIHVMILSFLYKKKQDIKKSTLLVREIFIVEDIEKKEDFKKKESKKSFKKIKTDNTERIISKLKKIDLGREEILKNKKIVIPSFKRKEEISFLDKDEMLINYFKSNLRLPEKGEVKVKIAISAKGHIDNIEVLSSKSLENEKYLREKLFTLYFPWILEKKSLIITFINENL